MGSWYIKIGSGSSVVIDVGERSMVPKADRAVRGDLDTIIVFVVDDVIVQYPQEKYVVPTSAFTSKACLSVGELFPG